MRTLTALIGMTVACFAGACSSEVYTDTDSITISYPGTDKPTARHAGDSLPGNVPVVRVDGPTIVGFFPPPEGESSEGYSEGIAHVQFGLDDAGKCLEKSGGRAVMVINTRVRIQSGERVDTIHFPTVDSLSFGAYLILPGKTPRLISAPMGPSALGPRMLEAIPGYFNVAECPER